MKVLDVIARSSEFLIRKGVESPRLQVELILAQVLQLPRLKLYLNFDRELNSGELDRVRGMVARRGEREPLQHILGSTWFCGLEFAVNPQVLIPRPETEMLAERAWTYLNSLPRKEDGAVHVADVGTGSGCLAVTVAVRTPAARIEALDISGAALEVAQKNAVRHGVSERIEFRQSDLFGAVAPERRFDLVVSNPPYIPTSEIEHLQPEVRDHDPRCALDGGADGLEIYRRLAAETPERLNPEGVLMAEFGDGQETQVTRCFEERHWTIQDLVSDLAGKPRIVIARKPLP